MEGFHFYQTGGYVCLTVGIISPCDNGSILFEGYSMGVSRSNSFHWSISCNVGSGRH